MSKVLEIIISEKNKISNMNKDQKWDYFKDYYLAKTIVLLVALVLLVWFIKDTFFQKAIANSGCVYGVEISEEEKNALTEGYLEYYKINEKEYCAYISTDNMFEGTEQKMDARTQEMALFAQISAGEIYYLILDEENLNKLSNGGVYASIDEVLSNEMLNVIWDSVVTLTDKDTGKEYAGAIDLASSGILGNNREGFLIFTIGAPGNDYPDNFLKYLLNSQALNSIL